MANPYSHTFTQRWTDGQATTTERLNIAREGVDHAVWRLDQFTDADGEYEIPYTAPMIWKDADAGEYFAIWVDPTDKLVRFKQATGSAPTPASADDGNQALLDGDVRDGPSF